MEILKVASKTNPNSLAGAIAASIRENGSVLLQAVGASAVNQAVKGIAIARNFLLAENVDIFCVPAFEEIVIEEEKRTALRFTVDSTPVEDGGGEEEEALDGEGGEGDEPPHAEDPEPEEEPGDDFRFF